MGSGGTGINAIDSTLDVVSNAFTLGTVGFGKEGFSTDKGFYKEDVGGATVDGIKEVTGANAAEEANEFAREQAEEAKVQADNDRKTSIKQNERRQVSASRSAGRTRKGSSNSSPNSSSTTGGGQDALGL